MAGLFRIPSAAVARARTHPPNREMCQAVYNACPGILEGPKAVANTALAVEVLLNVSRQSKCGIADADHGLGLGHVIRGPSRYHHHHDYQRRSLSGYLLRQNARNRLGRDLRDISVNDKFACDLTLPHHDISLKQRSTHPNSHKTT